MTATDDSSPFAHLAVFVQIERSAYNQYIFDMFLVIDEEVHMPLQSFALVERMPLLVDSVRCHTPEEINDLIDREKYALKATRGVML